MSDQFALARRVLVAALVVLAVFGVAYLLLQVGHALLLGFGGVLLAVLLDGLARWVRAKTKLGRGAALALVCAVLVGAFVGLGFWLGPNVSDQVSQMGAAIQGGQETLLQTLEEAAWAQPFVSELSSLQSAAPQVARRALGVFSTVLGGLTNLLIILFIGLYLAASPHLYQRGVLHLVDKRHRPRAAEVLAKVGGGLRSWLLGRVISMAVVGALTTTGLLLLGVPLALALGVIAFLFSFVPYIGPIASFIPAALVALVQSPQLALYTGALYAAVQFAESYLITPLVQHRVVSLPPALLIFSEVLLGTVAGVLGIALAVPLMVTVVIGVQMLYVEDVLGDHTLRVLGDDGAPDGASRDDGDRPPDDIDQTLAEAAARAHQPSA